MTPRYVCRLARREELKNVLVSSEYGGAFDFVLKPRFRSHENFLAEMEDAGKLCAFCVALDDSGRILGWACCFKFHERAGYSGVVQLALQVREADIGNTVSADLYRLCEAECRRCGVHTIVSFAHSRIPNLIPWHHANDFAACGYIDLAPSDRLHVFYRKLAHDQIG